MQGGASRPGLSGAGCFFSMIVIGNPAVYLQMQRNAEIV